MKGFNENNLTIKLRLSFLKCPFPQDPNHFQFKAKKPIKTVDRRYWGRGIYRSPCIIVPGVFLSDLGSSSPKKVRMASVKRNSWSSVVIRLICVNY